MTLTPYRETLALRGIKSLLIVATLARIPITAGSVVLTLHVTQDLGLGYGAAGLVGAAFTVAASLGAPVMGRITDRRGLRPVLVLTTVAEVAFWTAAQGVPYWALLVAALIGGFLTLPAFAVARQSIAALAPESHRLPAFALDSITTELSFMAGPALGVLISTTAGARVAMLVVGGGILLSGVGLYLLDPPIRGHDEAPISAGHRVPRSAWLRPRLIAVLAITSAATLVLSGTDVAVVAVLQHSGEVEWTGAVLAMWAAYSLLGGFTYGMVRQGLPPLLLLAPMAVFTIPVGLGGSHWWLLGLLLLPAGALCAPTITATADAVSRLTPAAARGEAMGWHNSSLTVGVALGAPLAGVVMDSTSPPWGFVTVGGVGVLVALLVAPIELRRRRAAEAQAATEAARETTAKSAGEAAVEAARETTAKSAGEASVKAARETTGKPAAEGAGNAAGEVSAWENGAAGPAVDFPTEDAPTPAR